MRHTISFIFIIFFMLTLPDVSFGQEATAVTAASIILKQALYFADVHSVEYTIKSGEEEKGDFFSKVLWKEMGNKYFLDYHFINRPGKKEVKLLVSYDGEHGFDYQQDGDFMSIQKKPLSQYNPIIADLIDDGPFFAFRFMVRRDMRERVEEMSSESTLKSVAERATLEPGKNRSWGGHPCIAVRISDGYDRTRHKVVDYVVYFATDCALYPIAWEMFSKQGHLETTFRVKQLKTLPTTGGDERSSFRYPGVAYLRSSQALERRITNGFPAPIDDETFTEGLDGILSYPDLRINHLQQSDFALDPSMASNIIDLDTKKIIVVPK
jgi:hypothetical protein